MVLLRIGFEELKDIEILRFLITDPNIGNKVGCVRGHVGPNTLQTALIAHISYLEYGFPSTTKAVSHRHLLLVIAAKENLLPEKPQKEHCKGSVSGEE